MGQSESSQILSLIFTPPNPPTYDDKLDGVSLPSGSYFHIKIEEASIKVKEKYQV
jgi:hypothetical protein